MNRTSQAAAVIIALALAAAAAHAASEAGPPWTFPLTASQADLEAACGREATLVDEWTAADLRYDPARDGVFGTVEGGYDVWLRDTKSLADNAMVIKYEGPLIRCRSTSIEVWSPASAKLRRVKESELAWSGQMGSQPGILHLDVMVYAAVIPGLRAGDRVRVIQKYDWNGMHGLPTQTFRTGKRAPARQLLRLLVPADQAFAFELCGPDSLTSRIAHDDGPAGKARRLSWELRLARPAGVDAKREASVTAELVPHLSVADAARPHQAFAGAASWAAAAVAYREAVNQRLEPTPEIAAEAERIVAGVDAAPARIAALYAHVQRVTRYLGLYDGRGGIIPAQAEQTHRAGYGDCKGMATYFIALCRAVGIPAWPVLVLSTDSERFADTLPNLTQFNHFIAWADDGNGGVWIDPTLEDLPPGVLVPDDAEHPVLTTRPGAEGLCRIPREAWDPGLREYAVNGAIDETLRLRAIVTLAASGPGGRVLAARLDKLEPRQRETRLRELLVGAQHRATAAVPTSADTSGGSDPLRTWSCGVETAQPLPGSSTRLFLPAEIALLPELVDRQPGSTWLPTPPRRADRHETWRLALPPGWHLAAADSAALSAPGVTWTRVVLQEGADLVLRRSLDWGDSTITTEQEAALRSTLATIDARERAPLQLVKETP